MAIESMMPSNCLILYRSLFLPSIFPSIRVFSSESTLCIRWPKYWSFSISPSNEFSGLISFRMEGTHRKWFNEGRSVLRRRTSTVKVQKYEKAQQIQGTQSRSTWLGLECTGWAGWQGLRLEWKLESNPKGLCGHWPWSQWEELKGFILEVRMRLTFRSIALSMLWQSALVGMWNWRNSSSLLKRPWQEWTCELMAGCGSENTEWSLDFWTLWARIGSCWWSIVSGVKKKARIRTPFLGKTEILFTEMGNKRKMRFWKADNVPC